MNRCGKLVLQPKFAGLYGFAETSANLFRTASEILNCSKSRGKDPRKPKRFSWSVQGSSGGKSKSPGPQMISICVLTLTRTSLTAEYYSAQVHLNGMERYRQVCRMHRIICAWPHSSSAIFSSIQRCVPAFSASASYASCAVCSSE